MSYWYIAHNDELLLDIDDYMRPTKTGCPWGEAFFRRRLRDAMAANKLKVSDVFVAESTREKHYHIVVRLMTSRGILPGRYDEPNQLQRLIWQLHLGSDLYRGRADLMRFSAGMEAPSLIIRSTVIPKFYRNPDYTCECVNKHDTEQQLALGEKACEVWKRLRGLSPWQLFGPSRKLVERFVPLPLGRVPLQLIMSVELQDYVESEE